MGSSVSTASPKALSVVVDVVAPAKLHEPFASNQGTPTQATPTMMQPGPIPLDQCDGQGCLSALHAPTASTITTAQNTASSARLHSNSNSHVDVLLGDCLLEDVLSHPLHASGNAAANDGTRRNATGWIVHCEATTPTAADRARIEGSTAADEGGGSDGGAFRELTSSLELDADTLLGRPEATSELIARARNVVMSLSPHGAQPERPSEMASAVVSCKVSANGYRLDSGAGGCGDVNGDVNELSDDMLPFSTEFEAFLRQLDDVDDDVHAKAFTGQCCRRYTRRSDGLLVFSPLAQICNSPLSKAASDKRKTYKQRGVFPIRQRPMVSVDVSPFPSADAFGDNGNDMVVESFSGLGDDGGAWMVELDDVGNGDDVPEVDVSHYAQRARKRRCV